MVLSLINNISLLLAMSICHSFILKKVKIDTLSYKISAGILFGLVTIAGMMNPYVLTEGIIFDGRSLVASIAGLFGGPITAAIVILVGGLYRLFIGGPGTLTGILTLITSGGLGASYYYLRRRKILGFSDLNLYLFGLVVHLVMLVCMLAIPYQQVGTVLKTISLPVMILFPIGTLLLGKLLYEQQQFQNTYHKLNESEERYRSLFENNHAAMLLVNPEDGTIIDANPAACRFYGYTRDELQQLNISQINLLSFPEIKNEMQQARTAQKNYFSFKHRLAHGEIRDVEIYSGNIRINGKDVLYSLIFDVTEKKLLEEKLKQSEERYRIFVENAPDGIFVQTDMKFAYINTALIQLLGGRSQDDFLGRPIFDFIHPDLHEIIHERIHCLNVERKSVDCIEEMMLNLQGGFIHVEVNAVPLRYDNKDGALVFVRNIEERKRQERLLKESEKRFRFALSEMPFPVIIHDEMGTIHFINNVFTEITGYTLQEIPTIDEWTYKAYGEKMNDVKQVIYELYHLNHRVDEGEFQITTKYGDTRIWEFSTAPLRKDERGHRLVISVAKDITKERKFREEFEQHRQILITAMEQSQAGIAIAEAPTGTLRYVNQAGLAIRGKSRQEVVNGIDFVNYVNKWAIYDLSGDPLDEDEVPLARAVKYGENCSREFIIRRGKNDDRIVFANAAPIKNPEGTVTAAVVVFLDITEMKQAEIQQQKLITAIEQSQEMLVITDTQGNIEYVNPAFEKMTGYTKEEVLGQNPRLLKSRKQDNEFYKNLWTTITKEKTWTGEFVNTKKDGTLCYVSSTISPVFNSSGKIINYVAVNKDVTKEKQMESQLIQAQKMESIGHLAGGVAHDFNNILTAIIGYNTFAQMKVNKSEPLYEDLIQVGKSAERAMNLTRQLLAFSRKQILQPELINLNQLIYNLDKMLRRLISENIDYITIPQEGLWTIHADPGQIEQIIINLVVNARDAMPTGGKLVIETKNVYLDEDYASQHAEATPGEHVMVAVSDTGLGIERDILDQIFDPFFTTKQREKGTGLGLSMVHGIVKQSGGNIYVYSEVGKGSTFKIYLPRAKHDLTYEKKQPEAVSTVVGTETIMIVEDDPMVLQLVQSSLESAGYKVLVASHGLEAIEQFEQTQETIQLLITDVIMPKMSGKDLSNMLTKKEPALKTLYISGYTDNAIVHYGILDEGIKFLQKPFTHQSLLQRVRTILDQ